MCLKSEIFTFLCALINVSTLLTVFLGIDRYLHMNPDIRNRQSRIKKIFKTPCIYYLIGFLVTFLMAYFAFAAFYIHGNAFIDIASFFLTSLVTTAITITACLYTKGYLRIRNFTDSNPVYCNSGGSSERPEYVRSLYKTVMVLVCLVCIHYLPLSIISIVAAILKYSKISFDGNLFAYFYEFAVLLVYASWFTNSFAILYFNKKAKNWIISKLRLKHAVNQTTNTDLDSDNMKNCKIEIELKWLIQSVEHSANQSIKKWRTSCGNWSFIRNRRILKVDKKYAGSKTILIVMIDGHKLKESHELLIFEAISDRHRHKSINQSLYWATNQLSN